MKLLLFKLMLFCAFPVMAQKYTLTGTVKNADNKAIAGATLYISGSKMTTVSDDAGRFSFQLEKGSYDILTQMIGYSASNKQVNIVDGPVQVHIKMMESSYNIQEVVIRADPNRARYIQLFKDYFLGRTPNALKTKILNPEVLMVDFNKELQLLTVKSDQLLKIENPALGYTVNYLISQFEYSFRTQIVYYEGYPAFQEMKGNKSALKRWEKARAIAFAGSPTHFFQSLAKKTAYTEGFKIHKISGEKSPLTLAKTKDVSLGSGMDMLSKDLVLLDTLVKEVEKDIFSINFSNDLYVVYEKEREPAGFDMSGFMQNRPPEIKNFQVSRIIARQLPILFYGNGVSLNPAASLMMGHFAWEKFADMLPIEYELPKN